MTEELFREDAYARSCAAEVISALDLGVCLDRTVFYCQGGGQPGDRGRLHLADGTALEVIDNLALDRQCFVGRPQPSFEYWLSGRS